MRVDFSLQCKDNNGVWTGEYIALIAFTVVMLVVHTIGTPLMCASSLFSLYSLYSLVSSQLHTFYLLPLPFLNLPSASRRYAYLFFVKFKPQLHALEQQELADYYKEKLEGNNHLKDTEKEVLAPLGAEDRVTAKELLPGYMRKLTAGCECHGFPTSSQAVTTHSSHHARMLQPP